MWRLIYVFIFALSIGLVAKNDNTCLTCHLDSEESEKEPAHLFKDDIHAQKGLTCADCHGGDPTSPDADLAMSKARGFIGVPDPLQIPRLCGSCHSDIKYMKQFDPNIQTDQFSQYLTSEHGKLWKKGDKKVATCVSCHSVHDIRSPKDFNSTVFDLNIPKTCARCHSDPKYMAGYNIPTNQYDEYAKSVHGKALLENGDRGAPACNDCHGNHGAIPPDVESISTVCGVCHSLNTELFLKSPKKAIFEELDQPGCETCHGNHDIQATSDEMLGVGEKAVCANCHDDEESTSYQKVKLMRSLIDSLRTNYESTDQLLKKAEEAGMEVSDARFEFLEVKNALTRARGLIHAFDPEVIKEEIAVGLTKDREVKQYALSALGEIRYRRTGLLIALFFVLILIVGLYFKVREVDRKYGVKKE